MTARKDELTTIRDMYNRIADQYERAQDGRFAAWILRDSRARAARHAAGRLLDIGIGSGASLPFYSKNIEVTGIDLSAAMLSHAERRLSRLGLSGELRVMDAQHLDFPDGTFDSVAFNLVLCTIPDQDRALREAVRVAKPGAPMTFLEHVRSDRAWVAVSEDILNGVCGRAFHDRLNSDTERMVRNAGIEVLSVERWLLGAMTLIVGRRPVTGKLLG